MSSPPTKDRLLDSAEQLFAERGHAETSLRELTQAAGCNLAAVSYHFGSKEALVHAVIARRFQPINEQRIALLDELEAAGEPGLEELLRAFVEPVLRPKDQDQVEVTRVCKLLMQVATMNEELACEYKQLFQTTCQRFVPAFCRALPGVEPRTVFWRITFMVAVVAMSFSERDRLDFISGGAGSSHDQDEGLEHMLAFLAGGLRAEAPGGVR
jgi:AcrR family transcriptional regulator